MTLKKIKFICKRNEQHDMVKHLTNDMVLVHEQASGLEAFERELLFLNKTLWLGSRRRATWFLKMPTLPRCLWKRLHTMKWSFIQSWRMRSLASRFFNLLPKRLIHDCRPEFLCHSMSWLFEMSLQKTVGSLLYIFKWNFWRCGSILGENVREMQLSYNYCK